MHVDYENKILILMIFYRLPLLFTNKIMGGSTMIHKDWRFFLVDLCAAKGRKRAYVAGCSRNTWMSAFVSLFISARGSPGWDAEAGFRHFINSKS